MSAPARVPIRVRLPQHLRSLAKLGEGELVIEVEAKLEAIAAPLHPSPLRVTRGGVLDAIEAAYPALLGTIRDHKTKARRPFVRFFACGEDLSHEPADAPLPSAVVSGAEPFMIIGAMAGG